MRALGFSRMDSKAEAEFIQEGIKECIDEGLVLKNQKLNRGSMVVAAGESMAFIFMEDMRKTGLSMNIIFHF